MNRRRSICFLCIGMVIVLGTIIAFLVIDNRTKKNQLNRFHSTELHNGAGTQFMEYPDETSSSIETQNMKSSGEKYEEEDYHVETMKEIEHYSFQMVFIDQKLYVYDLRKNAPLFDTGIVYSQLSESMILQVENGLYFEDEESLLAFLENLSS